MPHLRKNQEKCWQNGINITGNLIFLEALRKFNLIRILVTEPSNQRVNYHDYCIDCADLCVLEQILLLTDLQRYSKKY